MYTPLETYRIEQEVTLLSDRRLSESDKFHRVSKLTTAVQEITELLEEIYTISSQEKPDLIINIAGTIHATTLATMLSEPNSILVFLFDTTYGLDLDCEGRPYFDDPLFRYILEYLTMGHVDTSKLSVYETVQLAKLVDRYSINGMKNN